MKKVIEKIFNKTGQPNMVGDGFRVFNYIPHLGVSQQRMSPFLLLDFNPAYDFGPSTKPLGVGVHPHKGFETVTIAYKGSVAHSDSSGSYGVIKPGDVQWMTAGNGILHKEFHEEEFSKNGGLFEMVQLWVNLPKKDKGVAPHYQELVASGMGIVEIANDGGVVNVIAGSFEGTPGPANTYSDINLFDVKLNSGKAVSTRIPSSHNTAILVVSGEVTINGNKANEHSFVLFTNEGEDIEIVADTDSVLLVMSGEPLNEPIVSYGPFVMNNQAEIHQAIEDYNMGKFGYLA